MSLLEYIVLFLLVMTMGAGLPVLGDASLIAAVTLANFVGSSAAVSLGRRFIRARRQ